MILKIVTPKGIILSEEVDEVKAPGHLGQIGVLPDHTHHINLLDIGVLSYRKGGTSENLASHGGILEILDNQVRIVANAAERPGEVDKERALKAKERAENRLMPPQEEEIDIGRAEVALKRAIIRLKLKEESD